ncbi:MAG: glycosyltransferase family 2 protein, partial [Lachnospiraceae bacterium]
SATFAQSARRFGLYQRMDYMLHVPIADMNADNDFYDSVCRYLKAHYADTLRNPGLTFKNRLYLTLFTICPKFARKVHATIRL